MASYAFTPTGSAAGTDSTSFRVDHAVLALPASVGGTDATAIARSRQFAPTGSAGGTNATVVNAKRRMPSLPASAGGTNGSVVTTNRLLRPLGSAAGTDASDVRARRLFRPAGSAAGTSTVLVAILPPLTPGIGAVLLMEATDAGNPTTLGAIIPRDAKAIFLDQTRSVYTNPYTLLD